MHKLLTSTLVTAAALAGFAAPLPAPPTPAPDALVYPPCATEDSLGPCYWDARVRGNGDGASFVVHGDGSVQYVNPWLVFPGVD